MTLTARSHGLDCVIMLFVSFVTALPRPQWTVKLPWVLFKSLNRAEIKLCIVVMFEWAVNKCTVTFFNVCIANIAIFCSHWAQVASLCYWEPFESICLLHCLQSFTTHRYVLSEWSLAGFGSRTQWKGTVSLSAAAWSVLFQTVPHLALFFSQLHVQTDMRGCT